MADNNSNSVNDSIRQYEANIANHYSSPETDRARSRSTPLLTKDQVEGRADGFQNVNVENGGTKIKFLFVTLFDGKPETRNPTQKQLTYVEDKLMHSISGLYMTKVLWGQIPY